MAATLAAARAGATTGEWAGTLREVFGEFRAPTGVSGAVGARRSGLGGRGADRRTRAGAGRPATSSGGRLRLLVGKPGLDGHSNGAEQVAVRARDAGFEVDLPGHPAHARSRSSRRPSPRTCTASGSRSCPAPTWSWCPSVLDGLREAGLEDVPVIVGGIIPDSDGRRLARARRRRGLHAQGLRADRDHGRHRRRDPQGQRPGLTRLPAPGARPALERPDDPRGDPAAVEAARLGDAPPRRRPCTRPPAPGITAHVVDQHLEAPARVGDRSSRPRRRPVARHQVEVATPDPSTRRTIVPATGRSTPSAKSAAGR